jgi:hypothetical protein|tara:strand:- start:290 stop:481 length:192 start_codon:yes stop_codon:yes gene_type:complete
MDRHTKLLNEFSRTKTQAELLNKMARSRKAVEINANGTSGYKIKEGANAGKVIKHIKKTSGNI